MQFYKHLQNKEKVHQKFASSSYDYLDPKTKQTRVMTLIFEIEMAKGVNKRYARFKFPSRIRIRIMNPHSHLRQSDIFKIDHQLHILGLNKEEMQKKEEVCLRVRSLLNLIKFVGEPDQDFSSYAFEKAYKLSIKDSEDTHLKANIISQIQQDKAVDKSFDDVYEDPVESLHESIKEEEEHIQEEDPIDESLAE